MSDLFMVDNGDKSWKAKNYLDEWADLAHTFDVTISVKHVQATQHDHVQYMSDEGTQPVAALRHHQWGMRIE